MQANLLSAAGIAYDIVGVVLLAKAIVFVKGEVLSDQSGSYYGGNASLFEALERQRHDGVFGLGVLLFGFVGQLLAALKITVPLAWWPVPAIVLIVVVIWYAVSARSLRRTSRARFDAMLERKLAKQRAEQAATRDRPNG